MIKKITIFMLFSFVLNASQDELSLSGAGGGAVGQLPAADSSSTHDFGMPEVPETLSSLPTLSRHVFNPAGRIHALAGYQIGMDPDSSSDAEAAETLVTDEQREQIRAIAPLQMKSLLNISDDNEFNQLFPSLSTNVASDVSNDRTFMINFARDVSELNPERKRTLDHSLLKIRHRNSRDKCKSIQEELKKARRIINHKEEELTSMSSQSEAQRQALNQSVVQRLFENVNSDTVVQATQTVFNGGNVQNGLVLLIGKIIRG